MVARQEFEQIEPNLGQGPIDEAQFLDEDASRTRYLFSARLRVDTSVDKCEFGEIRPGEITRVGYWRYYVPNTNKIAALGFGSEGGIDTGEPSRVLWTRNPKQIADAILGTSGSVGGGPMQTPTGLIELVSLRGLDHLGAPHDRDFIRDVQRTLWPFNMPTAAEQEEWLERADLSEKRGLYEPDYFARFEKCREEMLDSLRKAARFAQQGKRDLLEDFQKYRRGDNDRKGFRSVASDEDAALCRWLSEPVPTTPTNELDGLARTGDLVGTFQQMMAQQNVMFEAALKGTSGNENTALLADAIRQQGELLRMLMERQNAPVVAVAPESVATAEPELLSTAPDEDDEVPKKNGKNKA